MKRPTGIKAISWFLIFAFVSIRLLSAVPANAEDRCIDPMVGDIIENCPLQELLDRLDRKAGSDLLDYWKKLPDATKDAYREYVKCTRALDDAKKQLASAQEARAAKETEYQNLKDELKKLLLAFLGRLGLQVGVIATNAIADAYLIGKSLDDAVSDGSRTPEKTAAGEAEAAEAQRLTSEAAKRQEYIASLEADLGAAEQRVAAAEARQAAATGPGGTGPERPLDVGQKPPSGSTGTAEPPTKPPGSPGAAEPSTGSAGPSATATGGKSLPWSPSSPRRLGLGLGGDADVGRIGYVRWSRQQGFETFWDLGANAGESFSKRIQLMMDEAEEIHFNLDGVDVNLRNNKLTPSGEPASGYTSYELYLIETNPAYRQKTVWHKGDQVMPPGFDPFK